MNNKKLFRSDADKMLGGVCSGLGQYFGIDPTIVRLGFALLGLVAPQTLLVYLVLWVVIPPDPNAPIPSTRVTRPEPPAPPEPPSDPTSPVI